MRPMLYGFESLLLPDSLDSLCYNWLEEYNKFSFTISPQVPQLRLHLISPDPLI